MGVLQKLRLQFGCLENGSGLFGFYGGDGVLKLKVDKIANFHCTFHVERVMLIDSIFFPLIISSFWFSVQFLWLCPLFLVIS